jgi:ABC-type glycerol-3-phosphate transport system substrate-binding protein
MVTRYGPPNAADLGFNEILTLFAHGQCGLWIDATVAAGTLFDAKASQVAAGVAVTAAPHGVSTNGTQWLWSWAFAIPTVSQKSDAAREFIEWATSKRYIARVAEKEGWLAVPSGTRMSTYANSAYQTTAPFAHAVISAIARANPDEPSSLPVPYTGIQYVAIPEFQAIGTRTGQEVAKYVTGGQSLNDTLAHANAAATESLKAAGYFR